jgi:hypothetical protein
MSRTTFIEYRGDGIWAYDVAVGIFLKHLIDCASKFSGEADAAWLAECSDRWRVNAVVSDFGLNLDEGWSQDQLQVVLRLAEEACGVLQERAFISADEMGAWNILEGKGVFARGAAEFPTEPVVELGRAIQALLVGSLPAAPEGTWWLYGTETGRSTLRKRS